MGYFLSIRCPNPNFGGFIVELSNNETDTYIQRHLHGVRLVFAVRRDIYIYDPSVYIFGCLSAC